jgi:hypothetical protein
MGKAIDLVGQRFARLVVIRPRGPNNQGNMLWECLCDCGKTTVAKGIYLRKGHTKTCGCMIVDERPADGLTHAHLLEILNYDPEIGVFQWKKKLQRHEVGEIAGKKTHGYISICINGEPYPAHRLAWLYVHGEWPGNLLDHINRQRSDNRIANLRLASPQLNNMNSSIQSNNTSGYKGVSWDKRMMEWAAYITLGRKKFHLGYFSNSQSAARAYDKAATERFGEFACLNFQDAT